jgi:ABC-type uncharacterized transport system YnjBCD ATPase subunit
MPSPSPPPPVLPISEHEDEIVAAVDANPVVVVIGETGSGKSTQLSQILHRRGYTRRGAIITFLALSRARGMFFAVWVAFGQLEGFMNYELGLELPLLHFYKGDSS